MKKFCFFIAAAMAVNAGIPAFAAPAVNIIVKDSYVQVEISGNIASGAENEAVSFYIADADAEEGQDDFAHADQKNTGAQGSYSFTARMNPELGGGAFVYTVKAAGAAAETGEINIVDMGKTLDILDAIKNAQSAADIETAFAGYDPCLGMPVYDAADKTVIYQGLFNGKDEISGTQALFEALKSLAVFAGLKQGSETMVQNGSLLYLDIIGAAEEAVNSYNTQLTDKGRTNVNRYVLQADYDNMEGYAAEFEKLVYTNILTNNKSVDYDMAEKIIQSYGDMIGINVAEYSRHSRKNEIRMAILNSGAENPDALKKAYETAVKSYSVTTGGNSGNGGNGGTGSSISTGYVPSSAGTVTPQNGSNNNAVSGFSDMGNYEWAENAVAGLKAKNVMAGRGGDIFAPQDNITREEFVKAIMSAFSLMPESTDLSQNKFSDVNPDEWYAPYIIEAEKLGVISGMETSVFGIGLEITRQDMAAIAFRALRYTKAQIDSGIDTDGFSDQDDVSEYASDGVKIFKKMGLLNGYPDGTFKPAAATVRAEAAQFIWNLMNLSGI